MNRSIMTNREAKKGRHKYKQFNPDRLFTAGDGIINYPVDYSNALSSIFTGDQKQVNRIPPSPAYNSSSTRNLSYSFTSSTVPSREQSTDKSSRKNSMDISNESNYLPLDYQPPKGSAAPTRLYKMPLIDPLMLDTSDFEVLEDFRNFRFMNFPKNFEQRLTAYLYFRTSQDFSPICNDLLIQIWTEIKGTMQDHDLEMMKTDLAVFNDWLIRDFSERDFTTIQTPKIPPYTSTKRRSRASSISPLPEYNQLSSALSSCGALSHSDSGGGNIITYSKSSPIHNMTDSHEIEIPPHPAKFPHDNHHFSRNNQSHPNSVHSPSINQSYPSLDNSNLWAAAKISSDNHSSWNSFNHGYTNVESVGFNNKMMNKNRFPSNYLAPSLDYLMPQELSMDFSASHEIITPMDPSRLPVEQQLKILFDNQARLTHLLNDVLSRLPPLSSSNSHLDLASQRDVSSRIGTPKRGSFISAFPALTRESGSISPAISRRNTDYVNQQGNEFDPSNENNVIVEVKQSDITQETKTTGNASTVHDSTEASKNADAPPRTTREKALIKAAEMAGDIKTRYGLPFLPTVWPEDPELDIIKKDIQLLEAYENNKVVIHVKTDNFSEEDVKEEMHDRCPGIVNHVTDVNVYDKSKTLILTYIDPRAAQQASQTLQAHLRRVAHNGLSPSTLIKSVGISKPPIIRDLRAYSQRIKEKYTGLPIVVYAEMPVIGKVFPEGRRSLHSYRLTWAAEAKRQGYDNGSDTLSGFDQRYDSVIVFLSREGNGGVFELRICDMTPEQLKETNFTLWACDQWPIAGATHDDIEYFPEVAPYRLSQKGSNPKGSNPNGPKNNVHDHTINNKNSITNKNSSNQPIGHKGDISIGPRTTPQ